MGSTSFVRPTVRHLVWRIKINAHPCLRDFISTPFPDDLQDDQTIDVVVMDFALDDFCGFPVTGTLRKQSLPATPVEYRETNGDIVVAVKVLDPRSDLKVDDMKTYADGIKINAIWGMYAGMNWQAGL